MHFLSCHKFFIATNDGSYEKRGLATDILKTTINQQPVDLVYAVGSVDMMQGVCSITKEKKIATRVILNPMMVDCMGMCGSCRVKVGDKMSLACIEGPEYNGHLIDFEDLKIRMNAFKEPNEWRNRPSQPSPGTNEPGTFKRFLSGILKN